MLASASPTCHALSVFAALLSPDALATRVEAIATASSGTAIVARRVASLSSLREWFLAVDSGIVPRQEVAAFEVDVAKVARVIRPCGFVVAPVSSKGAFRAVGAPTFRARV